MRYLTIGALGVASIIIGSLLFARAVEDGDGFWAIFLATVGVGILLSGVGEIIATIATYLRQGD